MNSMKKPIIILAVVVLVAGVYAVVSLRDNGIDPGSRPSAEADVEGLLDEAPVMSAEAWQQIERDIQQPVNVNIDESRVFVGAQPAQITIVSYANFLCSHCRRAFYTMNWILKDRFQGQARMLIKHRPDIQAWSFDAAGYFEAIAQRSHTKALEFYAALYTQQEQFMQLAQQGPPGETFLQQQVETLGFDFEALQTEVKTGLEENNWIDKLITADTDEFKALGATGTPSFVIYSKQLGGGVRVFGNYKASEFEKIISRLLN